MLIGGGLVGASLDARYGTESAAFEEMLAQVPAAEAQDVDLAVRAASAAARSWRETPSGSARQRFDGWPVLSEHEEEIALLDALDGGNPVTAMRNDVQLAANLMRTYADWALELKGETLPLSADHLHYTTRAPYGVVVRIVPHNQPGDVHGGAQRGPPRGR